MASLNKVILIGHLTKDPELKTTNNGVSVVSFTIGVSRRYKSGEEQVTDFLNCTAWRQSAEFVCKNFRKGNAICVCGSIQNRSYDSQDGSKRTVTEIIVDDATFVEKKSVAAEPSVDTPTPNYTEFSPNDDLPF